jgi:hypothetical protein
MASQKKIDANRRNAKKSTGPKTKAGKDKVSLNPMKHGAFARTALLAGEYKDWERLTADFVRRYLPEDEMDVMYINLIVGEMIRLKRIATAEQWFLVNAIMKKRVSGATCPEDGVLVELLIEEDGAVPEGLDRQRRRIVSDIEDLLKAWDTHRRNRPRLLEGEAPVRIQMPAPEITTLPPLEAANAEQRSRNLHAFKVPYTRPALEAPQNAADNSDKGNSDRDEADEQTQKPTWKQQLKVLALPMRTVIHRGLQVCAGWRRRSARKFF